MKLIILNEICYMPKCYTLSSYFVIFFKLVIQIGVLVGNQSVGVQLMQSGYIP